MKGESEEKLLDILIRIGSSYTFLRKSIENIVITEYASAGFFGTDGLRFFFDPGDPPSGEDAEHMVIHCLFRHLLKPEKAVKYYWDIACDISAEYIRTEMFPSDDSRGLGMRIRDILPAGVDPCSVPDVYAAVMDLFEDELEAAASLVRRDDHRFWYEPCNGFAFGSYKNQVQNAGKQASRGEKAHPESSTLFYDREMPADNERDYEDSLSEMIKYVWPSEDELPGGKAVTGEYGLSPGCREEKMIMRAAAKYDFSRYLRRFSTTKEEMRLDLSDFDYIPYYYGMERYGNMPLIEPLEYAESHKVEDLVIAIDTSGSCSLEIVERFLAEIEHMLLTKENFFRRMNVHVIQCDARVQDHREIHSQEEWRSYAEGLYIKGRGGTDFTPVFDLVKRLLSQGRLRDLKGLLYFTDGNGVYPQEETPYETAFVFTSKAALGLNIPKWITPLCLDMDIPGAKRPAFPAGDLFKYILSEA